MNHEPLISVIIPCYQAEKTLRATLADLFNQTHKQIEIITVNDGSTDKTADVLQKYQGSLFSISQENRGAAAARNNGFRSSKGEYVLFCDADVRLQPTMLAKMLDTLQRHPDKAYCYCNFKFGLHTFDLFPFDAERLKKENYISTMSLIRREKFIGFDENLNRYQDWDLWKRMLEKGDTGVWCPERLFETSIGGGISRLSLRNVLTVLKRKLFGRR